MGGALAWSITGAAVMLLLVVWHSMVWRELSARRKTLLQLARQVAVNQKAAREALGGPYEESARQALEVNRSVYGRAAAEYNALRKRPLYRLPAAVLGLPPAEELKT